MSSAEMKLSNDLSVPRTIAARTVFIAGTKGSGKTYNAGVIAEEMLAAGTHVVILDPLGVWYGLRHDRSGGPGGFPIVILGGEHADVPLLSTGGETVADFIVRSGQSCILDMSGFDSDAEQDRFVTALLRRLFRTKAADKAALHLIMDEADMFAPQSPMPGQQVMLGSTKTIVTKGRSRGLSMTMITQRPQSISTALRDEADVFLCHRIQGPRAADAVEQWVEQHASKSEAASFMASLPTLDTGECWVWSPHFLKLFKRVKFRSKATFDSSRTPDPGETARKPKAAARVDLDKLTTEMKATAEAAKASDPKALRQRVLELEKALASKSTAKVETKIVEKPVVTDAQVKRVETVADRLEAEGRRQVAAAEKLAEAGRMLIEQANGFCASLGKAVATPVPMVRPVVARPVAQRPVAAMRMVTHCEGVVGKGGLRRILVALAQRPGLTNRQIGIRAGLSSQSGTFSTYLGRGRSEGWIRDEGERRFITDEGVVALGTYEPLPTGQELLNHWLGELGASGAARMLRALADAYPKALTNEEIGQASGVSHVSGTFSTYMGRLRGLELIQSAGRGLSKASDELFDEVTA